MEQHRQKMLEEELRLQQERKLREERRRQEEQRLQEQRRLQEERRLVEKKKVEEEERRLQVDECRDDNRDHNKSLQMARIEQEQHRQAMIKEKRRLQVINDVAMNDEEFMNLFSWPGWNRRSSDNGQRRRSLSFRTKRIRSLSIWLHRI